MDVVPGFRDAPGPPWGRELWPCPACGGTGRLTPGTGECRECEGTPWRTEWPIDRAARPAARMAGAVASGEIAEPHAVIGPDGRRYAGVGEAVRLFPDGWFVSAYAD